jgi:hypothetical protein
MFHELKDSIYFPYAQKAYFSQILHFSFAKISHPSTLQVWHIKKLIKQLGHYKGAPCTIKGH